MLTLVKHLGVNTDFIEISRGLKARDYAAPNPNMRAPTLVDGDVVLWESTAIMAYLYIKHGSDMSPAHHPHEQVEVLRRLSWDDCHCEGFRMPAA